VLQLGGYGFFSGVLGMRAALHLELAKAEADGDSFVKVR
jgi:hypothetical protein